MIVWKWNDDFRFERNNSPGRIGAHFLCRFNRHPLQGDGVPLGGNPHNRSHACSQSSRDEICRRKRFPFPLVVDRGIGFQFGPRRAMNGGAVKLPLVTDGNLNQG